MNRLFPWQSETSGLNASLNLLPLGRNKQCSSPASALGHFQACWSQGLWIAFLSLQSPLVAKSFPYCHSGGERRHLKRPVVHGFYSACWTTTVESLTFWHYPPFQTILQATFMFCQGRLFFFPPLPADWISFIPQEEKKTHTNFSEEVDECSSGQVKAATNRVWFQASYSLWYQTDSFLVGYWIIRTYAVPCLPSLFTTSKIHTKIQGSRARPQHTSPTALHSILLIKRTVFCAMFQCALILVLHRWYC